MGENMEWTEEQGLERRGERAKRVGFYGAYSYDIVLYLARVLSLAGKHVLVIDRSTEQEVVRTIRTMKEGELQRGVFRFCGIDVTARVVLPESMNPEVVYDVILFDFGGNMCPEEYDSCDVICYVLDMYVHNALRVQEAETLPGKEMWMILRDLFRGKAIARYHMRLTGKNPAKEDVFTIRLNRDDFVARFRMETDQLPRVEIAGEEMQELIYVLATRIAPELNEKKGYKGLRKKSVSDRMSA